MYQKIFLTLMGLGMLSGCGNVDSSHLVFGQQHLVGLDITASAPEQGGSLSLGYKDKDLAVVPVAVKEGETYKLLGGTNNESVNADRNDAYSTLGQFSLDTGENSVVSVGLGKFFATGLAAQKLAEGFAAKLAK